MISCTLKNGGTWISQKRESTTLFGTYWADEFLGQYSAKWKILPQCLHLWLLVGMQSAMTGWVQIDLASAHLGFK